jgi:hypothetical protein
VTSTDHLDHNSTKGDPTMQPSKLKHASALAAAGALVAALIVPAANARTTFSGNVCGLLKPSQLATVEIHARCTAQKTAHLPTATIYAAVWSNGPGMTNTRLSVQVWKPKYSSFAATFKKEAHGTPVKIGSFARAEFGTLGENLYILAGGYGLLINLTHRANSTAENIGEIGAPMFKIGTAIVKKL